MPVEFSPPYISLTFLITAAILGFSCLQSLLASTKALLQPNRKIYFSYAALCFAATGYQLLLHSQYSASQYVNSSPDTIIEIIRWRVSFANLAAITVTVFIGLFSQAKLFSRGFYLAFTLLIVATIANHILPFGIKYDAPISLKLVELPWHETIVIEAGSRSIWDHLRHLVILSLMVWIISRIVYCWRTQSKRFAIMLIAYIAMQAITVGVDTFTDMAGLSNIKYSGFAILMLVVLASWEMLIRGAEQTTELQINKQQLQDEVEQRRTAQKHALMLAQVYQQSPLPTHIINDKGVVTDTNPQAQTFWSCDLAKTQSNLLEMLASQGARFPPLSQLKRSNPQRFSGVIAIPTAQDQSPRWVDVRIFDIDQGDKDCFAAVRFTDITDQRFVDKAIRHIARGVSAKSGTAFYHEFVINLQKLIGTELVLIGQLNDIEHPTHILTQAIANQGKIIQNQRIAIHGSPFVKIIEQRIAKNEQFLHSEFASKLFQLNNIEGYVGAPILDNNNTLQGVLIALYQQPITRQKQLLELFEIFAARAAAEFTRMESEQQIRKLAYEDYLTRLPNRALILEQIDKSSEQPQGTDLYFIDLDHFKTINDGLGHDVGDEVIRQAGQRLAQGLRNGEFIGRFGGDEFVVLSRSTNNIQSEIEQYASIILKLLSQPFVVGDHHLHINASIGIVKIDQETGSSLDIIQKAEIALYRAKSAGRSQYVIFEPQHKELAQDRMVIETALRAAIQEQRLAVHYQPQYDSANKMIGAEALVRWNDPEHGFVSPARFIPVAEESGLIHALGEFVMTQVLCFIQQHQEHLSTHQIHLSVNVSSWQFAQPDFVSHIIQLVEQYQISPKLLTLELTETALISDISEAREKLAQLRNYGIEVALDDFGTGYSSLAYLRELPIDWLKIDKAFVDELTVGSSNPLVSSIVSLGNSLSLKVIAEGVETVQQQDYLQTIGCNNFQGYLFSKPVPEADFISLMHKQ